MSSLTGNRTVVVLALLVTGAALASYAFLPTVAFAQNEPKWNDKHYEKHHWDKDSKSYKDDAGHEYKCETHHDNSWYYFYNGNFYKCDDYKPASPSETPY